MSDETEVRQQAREAIRAGKLPTRRPDRTWGGRGCGASCSICGEPVRPDEVEFELEYALDGQETGPGSYCVHSRCLDAWELERHRAVPCPEPDSGIRMNGHGLSVGADAGTIHGCERDTTSKRGPR